MTEEEKRQLEELYNRNPKARILAQKMREEHIRLWHPPQNGKMGIFTIKNGNEWLNDASKLEVPNMLFDEFWYQDEVCILFADTNTGKSILGVQIADSISRGEPIPGFRLQAKAQPVVYFDFELGEKQFERRYSNEFKDHYAFYENFYRAEINLDEEKPDKYKSFEDYLQASIEEVVKETETRILVIDNITYLKNQTEQAKDALPLMKRLMQLKKQYDISILVLAHTPKRDMSKPMTRNDLQGSKMLINFCDSSFCIGESTQDKGIRYLKQIKARSAEIVYDQRNVVTCRIDKPHNFLGFVHNGHSNEYDHLKSSEEKDKAELMVRAKELKADGMSQREIAEELGIGLGTVNRYLKAS